MRWRLIAIITVPTVTALILGVIQIVGSVNNYSSFKRVQDLANLNTLVVNAAGLLADERDDTAGYVAAGGQSGAAASVPLKATVTSDRGHDRPGHRARSPSRLRRSSTAAATARRRSLTSATACSPTSPT